MFERINKLLKQQSENVEGTSFAFWKGAFIGIALLSFLVMTLSGLFFRTGLPTIVMGFGTLLIGIVSFWLFRLLGVLIHKAIVRIPLFVFSLVFACIGIFILAKNIRFGLPDLVFYPGIAISILSVILLFGSSWVLIQGKSQSKVKYIVAIASTAIILLAGIYYFAQDGKDSYPITFEQTVVPLLSDQGVKSPGEKGIYKSSYFTYGSGADDRREEFSEGVKFKSNSVDASRLLPDWKESKAKWRERYWGFGVKEFPLNGRVWMPEGQGPFPIILIVHGNHGMEEHSDPGYAYLGELLSSRGFITVSVDENFINATWSGDFRGKEMPVRGWLLLKHLEQWKKWGDDSNHALYKKADLDNVILAGHSRGGEAAPIAANFNELEFFPDDANEKFDFHFGIKGVVAIAPTDKRYDRRINLENVNYFSIQGSHDSDEASFFGFRQYQRISFSDSTFHFKSGLYVHRANHGQFNSVWGRYDGGPPSSWMLNVHPLITLEDQQQIAKVYISAFAEAVLHNDKSCLDIFKNSAVAKDWLPTSILINTYKDSNTGVIASFEEDIDLTSATSEESNIVGEHFNVWREDILRFRDKDVQGNNAVVLGWDTSADSADFIPTYKIELKNTLAIDSSQTFTFLASRGNVSDLKSNKKEKGEKKENDEAPLELNFSIALFDSLGNKATVELNTIKKITPQLKVRYVKLEGVNEENFGSTWEPTLETIEIPFQKFSSWSNLTGNLKRIEFLFDKSPKGVVILDEIGLSIAK